MWNSLGSTNAHLLKESNTQTKARHAKLPLLKKNSNISQTEKEGREISLLQSFFFFNFGTNTLMF